MSVIFREIPDSNLIKQVCECFFIEYPIQKVYEWLPSEDEKKVTIENILKISPSLQLLYYPCHFKK